MRIGRVNSRALKPILNMYVCLSNPSTIPFEIKEKFSVLAPVSFDFVQNYFSYFQDYLAANLTVAEMSEITFTFDELEMIFTYLFCSSSKFKFKLKNPGSRLANPAFCRLLPNWEKHMSVYFSNILDRYSEQDHVVMIFQCLKLFKLWKERV